MIKLKNILIATLFLLLTNINLHSCTTAEPVIPIIDAYVKVDAKKTCTSFNIVWKFKKNFIASLAPYDTNKNGKFDKNEQEQIKNNFISYIEANGYFTDIVYTKKDEKVKKSKRSKLNITDSAFVFSGDDITYTFNCDTNFRVEKDHRLYIRFLDEKSNVNVALKDVSIDNYSGTKVIRPQDIRANIYFYKYLTKKRLAKDSDTCDKEHHEHEHI